MTTSTTTTSTHDPRPARGGAVREQWRRIPPHGKLLGKVAVSLVALVAALAFASSLVSTDVADFPGVVTPAAILA